MNAFRPSHADYTYQQKYGIRDYRGGGRSSARETIARVAAGAIAKLILREKNISIHRENTFGHPILFSYREATQHHKDDKQRFCTNFIYS